ncbi:MAG: polysaccharide pyruvyl transferase family protein, partial [Victivallaceae bacterium]|nr:polysaccharide pyruvyl transferase family protein [Victivallaceae bacterium]
MKILVGGVPFGCNNIGDEAILGCALKIFRRYFPDDDFTVSTGTPEITAKKLNVHTVPLYGFTPDSRPATEFEDFIRGFDLYIWAGSTGLSDYPQLSC